MCWGVPQDLKPNSTHCLGSAMQGELTWEPSYRMIGQSGFGVTDWGPWSTACWHIEHLLGISSIGWGRNKLSLEKEVASGLGRSRSDTDLGLFNCQRVIIVCPTGIRSLSLQQQARGPSPMQVLRYRLLVVLETCLMPLRDQPTWKVYAAYSYLDGYSLPYLTPGNE